MASFPVMAAPPVQIAFGEFANNLPGRGWNEWSQWLPADDCALVDESPRLEIGDRGQYVPTLRSFALRLDGMERPPAFLRESFVHQRQVDIFIGNPDGGGHIVVPGAWPTRMPANWPHHGRYDFQLGEVIQLSPDLKFVTGETNPLFRWARWIRDVVVAWKRRRKELAGFVVDPSLGRAVSVKILQAAAGRYPPGTPELIDTLAVWADHLNDIGCPACESWRALLTYCPATWRRPLPVIPQRVPDEPLDEPTEETEA